MGHEHVGQQPFKEGGTAVVEEGIALLDGPNGIAIAMTLDAAEQTGSSLIVAARSARGRHPATS